MTKRCTGQASFTVAGIDDEESTLPELKQAARIAPEIRVEWASAYTPTNLDTITAHACREALYGESARAELHKRRR